jgi:predicted ATPase
MELEALELSNFRAYREARLPLPPSGVVLLAGANNTGKSALLSGLDVVSERREIAMAKHIGSTEPPEVRARFRLTEEERSRIIEQLPIRVRRDALTRLEWTFVDRRGKMTSDTLRASAAGYPATPLIPLAWTDIPPGRGYSDVAFTGFNAFAEQPAEPNNAERGNSTGPERRSVFEVASIEEAITTGIRELEPMLALLNEWRARYYHLLPLRSGTERSTKIASNPKLTPTGSNLTAVLLDLQTNRIDLWQRLRKLLDQIIPEVGRLETPTRGDSIEIAFVDPFVPSARHNIKDLGTGVEQLLMTLVVGVTQQAPAVIVIEEPETNLHAGAQRALLELLREWSSERLFILSTHSPVLLDDSSTTAELFLTDRTQGVSTVTAVTDRPSEALTALGVRLSDVLSADRILLVEGSSDQSILTEFFPDLVRNPRLAIINGQGGDNARFAEMLESWVQTADRLGNRRILFLRDRDELSATLLEPLEASPAVHVLQRRELENYLLDTAAISKALMLQRPTLELDPISVGASLRELADQFRPAVVIKRVAWELAPIRLMDHELRDELAQAGVTLEQFRARIAERLPSEPDLAGRIERFWADAERDVHSRWRDYWYELTPGSDVLKSLWARYGLSYDKRRDGAVIARAMEKPPEELQDVLSRFVLA